MLSPTLETGYYRSTEKERLILMSGVSEASHGDGCGLDEQGLLLVTHGGEENSRCRTKHSKGWVGGS